MNFMGKKLNFLTVVWALILAFFYNVILFLYGTWIILVDWVQSKRK